MNLKRLRDFVRERAFEPGSGLLSRFFRWLDRLTSDYTNIQAFGLWIAAVATGIVAVVYAKCFRAVESLYEQGLERDPLLLTSLTPLFFLCAWWLVHRFSREASGSGIPQVMVAIELDYSSPKKTFVDRLLSIKTAVVKILSSLLCLAGGGAIGREGPTLQISGVIFHYFGKKVRRFYPNSDEQTWVIAGAAAGLASAFNTPLGGIVYAIEELGAKHFHRIRTALLSAVIISGLVAQIFLGSYLYLGFPILRPLAASQWGAVLVTGLTSGILGALFSRALLWANRMRKSLRATWKLALCTVACGVASGALVYFFPSTHGSGSNVISRILFEGEIAGSTLIGSRMLGTALSYLSGAAGGIFSPSLTIGACIGSKMALIMGSENVNLLAMLGMIGFLTGITHTPFTSFILVMEMSDRHSAVFPMMLAALVASTAAKSIQKKSFYESVRDDLIATDEAQTSACKTLKVDSPPLPS